MLAHSANKYGKTQSYHDHIDGVSSRAVEHATDMGRYSKYRPLLSECVRVASNFHDVGKLPEENQEFLAHPIPGLPLPMHHADAGTAVLLKKAWKNNQLVDMTSLVSALLVGSHHRGLVNFNPRDVKSKLLRDETDYKNTKLYKVSDANVDSWLKKHIEEMGECLWEPSKPRILPGMFYRMALSCIVDGDHTDTAKFYDSIVAESQNYYLRPLERLVALTNYVEQQWQNCDQSKEVNKIRNDLYAHCASLSAFDEYLVYCGAAVGNGKTTSIMAHLLRVASELGLRKIFVILPYTNIIDQSVKVYREALTLHGENPENIVAAHHHRVEFDLKSHDGIYNMSQTRLWRAPIIVTTAVQFFETLATSRPARSRKLHELPGSALFFDEAPMMLPDQLLPYGYKLIEELIDNWGCYGVLGSGTMTNFWDLKKFSTSSRKIPEIQTKELISRGRKKEQARIKYWGTLRKFTCKSLEKFVTKKRGPRLVIMSTTNNAARFSAYLRDHGHIVEHLDTSLTHEDQAKIIARINQRFENGEENWTLVATSIIEAGMDFSFRVGFREWNSLISVVQTGGRINRNCEYGRTRMLYMFDVVKNEESSFTELAVFRGRGDLAKKMVSRRMKKNKKSFFRITDRDIVKYFEEYTLGGVPAEKDKFVKLERATEFKSINEDFSVISNDGTVRALLNREMFEAIENGEKINWKEFEKRSVRIYRSKRMKVFLEESKIVEYLWYYSGKYDDFLGYYAQFYGCDDSDFSDFI